LPIALAITSGEATSPATQVNSLAMSGGKATSSSTMSREGPAARNARASREPMNPPPPVMSTFI